MSCTNLKKKAQTLAIRSQAHHKPNILWDKSAPYKGTSQRIFFCSHLCRGGDSRAIEQKYVHQEKSNAPQKYELFFIHQTVSVFFYCIWLIMYLLTHPLPQLPPTMQRDYIVAIMVEG